MPAAPWVPNQQNRISFVMVDSNNSEVAGLDDGFTLQIALNDGAFAVGAGTKAEIGSGWYTYLSTAAEAVQGAVVAIRVTGTGAVTQNLEYVVQSRNSQAVEFTYTVRQPNNDPIDGVSVKISTDSAGNNVAWVGVTDAFGVARDEAGKLPFLDPGTYYFWLQKSSYIFSNPDTETVS